jgi:tetratricopeptide (TPR) repeat protein
MPDSPSDGAQPSLSRGETEPAVPRPRRDDGGTEDAPKLPEASVAFQLGRAAGEGSRERFQVTGLLGSGASGRVYGLFDQDLRRPIALKVLAAGAGAAPEEIDDLLEEARITASLQHPNVLPVHDVAIADNGTPCFTMDRIDGSTLADAIDASSTDSRHARIATPNAVVTVFIAVCQAVSYAHSRRLVHQDLKPANILLGDFGEVRVLDWGSAVRAGDAAASKRLSGTPLYMSPEQARREYSDARSDVYCLGASLFHALVLRPPTWADDVEAFMEKKRRGVVDPLSEDEARLLPPALASIAMSAMSVDAADRYASAAAMAADLERFQAGLAVSVHREPLWALLRRWYRANRRLCWVVAVAALAVAALGAAFAREVALRSARWRTVDGEMFGARLADHWRLRSRDWIETEMHDEDLGDAGHLRREGGALILSGDRPTDLSWRDPIVGGLRVEWTYTPLATTTNLNCFIEGEDRDSGYAFHVAVSEDPTLVVLTRGARLDRLETARLPAPLVTGRSYRFAMERVGDTVRLAIDGLRLIEYEEFDPEAPASGTFGFDACIGAVNRIDDLRISHLPLARSISPIAYAKDLVRLGKYDLAYAQFADFLESYPGSGLAPEALYGMALSRSRADRGPEAAKLLDDFARRYPDHPLIPYCLRERIGIAYAARDQAALERAISEMGRFRGHPLVKSVATVLAADEIAGIGVKSRTAAGEEWFPDDVLQRITDATGRTRRWLTTLGVGIDQTSFPRKVDVMLRALGRDDLILDLFKDQDALCAEALVQLGRYDEALARYPGFASARTEALLWSGRYQQLLDDPSAGDQQRRSAAIALGGIERGLELFPRDATMLTLAGRYDDAMAVSRDNPIGRTMVLTAQGRYEEALASAGRGWQRWDLLLRLGRFTEAEPLLATDQIGRYSLAWRLVAAGRVREGRDLLARLQGLHHPPIGNPQAVFAHCFLPMLLANRDGEAVDPAQALAHLLGEWRGIDWQWPWHEAALVVGRIDEAAFRAQPMQLGLERRLHLAHGMRAELGRDWPAAIADYRAYRAITADGMTLPSDEYVEWRLAELEQRAK